MAPLGLIFLDNSQDKKWNTLMKNKPYNSRDRPPWAKLFPPFLSHNLYLPVTTVRENLD